MDFASLVIRPELTIRDALARIDAGGEGLVLVEDAGRLLGVVTDGDVRRGLLVGMALTDPLSGVLNVHPATVRREADQDEVERLKSKLGVRHIPVVDDAGRVVDLVGPGERIASELTTPVVLMAGGRGKRLYPLTKDVPKPMVPIGGVPMIELILGRLKAQGFRRLHISVNYLGHLIEEHLGDGSSFGLEIDYLYESSPLGTAGALAQLDGKVAEPFVVMNSDVISEVDLRRMLTFHRRAADGGTVGVREYSFEIPFGVVRLSGETVESLVEKPQHRELVSSGMYILDPRALAYLEPETYRDMPDLLAQLIDSGLRVGAFPIHESWLDVGRVEDLERARAALGKEAP